MADARPDRSLDEDRECKDKARNESGNDRSHRKREHSVRDDRHRHRLSSRHRSHHRRSHRDDGHGQDTEVMDDGGTSSRRNRHRPSHRRHRHRRSGGSESESGSDSDPSLRLHRAGRTGDGDARDGGERAAPAASASLAAAHAEFGARGILRASDLHKKMRELECWLREVKGLAPEGMPRGELAERFKDYAEDFNTVTLPHDKYYDLDAWEFEEMRKRRARAGEAGGDAAVSVMADEVAVKRERAAARAAAEQARLRAYTESLSSSKIAAMRAEQLEESHLRRAYQAGDSKAAERLRRKLEPDK